MRRNVRIGLAAGPTLTAASAGKIKRPFRREVDEDSVRLEAGDVVCTDFGPIEYARGGIGPGVMRSRQSTSPKDIYVSKSPSDSPTKEVARSDRPETEESFWPLPPRKRLTSERMRVAEANGRGERGRSVRQRRKSMPLPISRPSSGTGAFGQRNRERDFGEVAIFQRGLAGDRSRQQCLGRRPEKVPAEVARFPPGPDPPRRRKPCLHGRGIRS